MRDLAVLPKAELHVPLEGAIRLATVHDLADRTGAEVPSGLAGGRWRFAGFDDFIAQYTATCALLAEPEDFGRVAYEFCEDEARTGVRYVEVVFSPSNHARVSAMTGSGRSRPCWTASKPAGATSA